MKELTKEQEQILELIATLRAENKDLWRDLDYPLGDSVDPVPNILRNLLQEGGEWQRNKLFEIGTNDKIINGLLWGLLK